MPARWPTSEIEVSQLPRWPTASLILSSAEAVLVAATSAASAQANACVLIQILPDVRPLFRGLLFSLVFHAFERGFAAPAETTPVRGLGHHAFVGADGGVADARLGGADRRAAGLHGARGLHHQAAEGDHGDVAGADALERTVGDRAHAFPHRDVLVGNAGDAGEVAGLHGGAILAVHVVARALAVEVGVDVD